METKEYRFMDKVTWGEGPWLTEPDKVQFEDVATKLPCLIRRAGPTGALCGYVGVPEGHPWFGKDLYDIEADLHGGVTFTDRCQPGEDEHAICHVPSEGESDVVWWVGFDCSHSGDLSPAFSAYTNAITRGTYRDIDYVKAEIADLARQAIVVGVQ